jgi:RNA polymerase sigma-70 factor (ECF subfamily)
MTSEDHERRDVDVEVGRAWREHRRHVLDVAFRMLGNLSEAEDVVQEAYARLVVADVDSIQDVGGWLVVVASRLCLDRLRGVRRRPVVLDPSVTPAAGDAAADPADRLTLDEQIRVALHVMLERLTPAERTAFVLHDVFQYPFDAIAEIVGRSPAACRQLASRARRAVSENAGPSRFAVESAEQRRVVERFIAACVHGDINGLLAVLDPAVAGDGDLGGGRTRVAYGAQAIAQQVLGYLGPASSATLVSLHVGDEAQVVALLGGHVAALVTLSVHAERIHHIHALADPVKLAPIADILGDARLDRSP